MWVILKKPLSTGHGFRSNRTNPPTFTYAYKDKNLGSNTEKYMKMMEMT